jgi:hypothetical protein
LLLKTILKISKTTNTYIDSWAINLSVLDETDIGSLLSERLSADVKTVLADNSVAGSSDTARKI